MSVIRGVVWWDTGHSAHDRLFDLVYESGHMRTSDLEGDDTVT